MTSIDRHGNGLARAISDKAKAEYEVAALRERIAELETERMMLRQCLLAAYAHSSAARWPDTLWQQTTDALAWTDGNVSPARDSGGDDV